MASFPKIKCLAVLLFHNDEDLVEDQINYYGNVNEHELIVFNHNSSDKTSELIAGNKDKINCIYDLSDKIVFRTNEVHSTIYKILLGRQDYNKKEVKLSEQRFNNFKYSAEYDWISFPESDEFLEGPNRSLSYYEHLCNISPDESISRIVFDNIIYWFTEKDDPRIQSPIERIKYYSYKSNCGLRLYAWRGHATAVDLFFGHPGSHCATAPHWKTRHYEMRSRNHLVEKVKRYISVNPTLKGGNRHYRIMHDRLLADPAFGDIPSNQLHHDDGIEEICMVEKYDWKRNVY